MPEQEPFPWHLGIYDAHCHPTDTMSSIPSLPTMKTRCLTIMATRAQDQHLVAQVANNHGVTSASPTTWPREQCIVPCFGWHPWFAHMMYLDDADSSSSTKEPAPLTNKDQKINHYATILQPSKPPLTPENKKIYLSLPDPTPFSAFLSHTRAYLKAHPYALVGEIGLDRPFRIPQPLDPSASNSHRDTSLTPGGREGRRLTPFRCSLAHQKEILKRQLRLAAECGRAVSIHGVQAHGTVFETLKELWEGHERRVLSKRERKKRGKDVEEVESGDDAKEWGLEDGSVNNSSSSSSSSSSSPPPPKPYPPRICLHSYSGSVENFKQYLNPAIPVEIFASFSTAINLGDTMDQATPDAFVEMIKAVPDAMLLVESDLHVVGDEMDSRLEDIVRRVCAVKGWGLEEGVERLGKNWRRFVFGTDE